MFREISCVDQEAIKNVHDQEHNHPNSVDPYIGVVGGIAFNEAPVIDGSNVTSYTNPPGRQAAFVQIYGDYDSICNEGAMAHFAARALAACAWLFTATPLAAQNLVQNPGFASDVSSWDLFTAFELTEQWTSTDAASDTHSGSIQGTLPASGTFRTPVYAFQCVVVQPNTNYAFGAKVLLPSATTPANAHATVNIGTYANTSCSGNQSMNIAAPNVTALDAWTQTSASVTTGAVDQSARVNLSVFAPINTTLVSNFDDVFVIVEPLTSVTLQSFNVE